MDEAAPSASHFSPRRRTAVVLTGEGTGLAYLSGVVKALEAGGVRVDLVLGRGAGAVVAAFAAVSGNHRIHDEDGLVAALGARRPFRLRPFHRLAAACLSLAFAFFLAPALLGVVSIVALPARALVAWLLPAEERVVDFLPSLYDRLETYYLPAIALPLIVLFLAVLLRWFSAVVYERRLFSPLREYALTLLAPGIDLSPSAHVLQSRLWHVVRGASTEPRPRSRTALGEAYRDLLRAGIGQHGFRELLFYALDGDTGREVPFVLLKERHAKALAARREAAETSEPVDLSGAGAPLLFDALLASVSPPALVPGVPIKLPLGSRFGGEVHRFHSSILLGRDTLADAIAAGAEQILYVTSVAPHDVASGSAWERLSVAAVRRSFENDLAWAAASSSVPVFVLRPDVERLLPFEMQGRAQLGGERLSPLALVSQGERDALHQFVHPVLGEDVPAVSPEAALSAPRDEWEAGPNEL